VPHTARFPRAIAPLSFERRLVTAAACLLAAGCSAGSGKPESRLKSLAVEPELPAATASADPRRHASGRVPQVIAPPRPYRVAEAVPSGVGRGVPPTMAPTIDLVPPALATAAGGTVRLTAAEEPGHLPVAVAAEAAPVVAEIRDMLAGYLRAFNRHDAPAVAAHWAAAGENVNLDSGEVTAGREAVRSVFESLFAVDPEATIDIDVASIKPLRDDVAVIDGVSRVAYADGGVASSRFSAVAARNGDRWQLESVRESAATRETAAARPLDALAWLVGAWEDVGEGVTAGSRCDWSPGRGFLVRSHSVAPDVGPAGPPPAGDAAIPGLLPTAAKAARELTEIIGWDPERQEIRSWMFSADGRFAEAAWRRDGEHWTIQVEGQGADLGRSATCTLLPAGPDALEIRCEGTGLDGLLPPACGFTRTAR
jgi:uncharacterized protein (TIGR02246 family)